MSDESGRANGAHAGDGSAHAAYQDPADDKAVLAAEYALGTLDADDRANVQMLMAIDPTFAAAVADWERRLGELHALVGPVEPPAATWDWIKARVATEPQRPRLWLPTTDEIAAAAPVPRPRVPPLPAEDEFTPASVQATLPQFSVDTIAPPPTDLWRRRTRRWRFAAAGIGALAAAFVAVAGLRELHPDMLPAQLRPLSRFIEKPVEVIRTVEVVREIPSPRVAEYVAVLQKDAESPAFMLTIDLSRRTFSVRRVGAAQQSGKDYELWLVSDKLPAPRSLGVVGEQEFTVRRDLTDFDAPTLNAATYSVSVEPAGGSPSGAPTGPVVFTGKLLQITPAAFPGPAP